MQECERDSFKLNRFIEAQNRCYSEVKKELKQGKKASHWIWFLFPQITGLGHSATAEKYAIKSLEEANAYLQDPVLGKRLIECTRLAMAIKNCSAQEIFGYPDYLKFHSSMTLFAHIEQSPEIFKNALIKFYNGLPDKNSFAILNNA